MVQKIHGKRVTHISEKTAPMGKYGLEMEFANDTHEILYLSVTYTDKPYFAARFINGLWVVRPNINVAHILSDFVGAHLPTADLDIPFSDFITFQ